MKQQLMRNGFLFILFMGLTSAVFAQPTVTSTSPSKNQNNVSGSGNISITFSEAMKTSTLTASTIKVKGSISGSHAGSISFSNGNATVTFNPTADFTYGESVTVTITTGAQNSSDVALAHSYSWSFMTKTLTNGNSYTNTTYTTGYGPRDVRIADVDGDADNDLVVLNYDWDNVSVLKNNGDGTYAAKTDYPLGDNPLFLAISDVDNDNDIDIISTNSFGLSLSVLKNNGNGTFAAKVDYATPFQSRTVSAADVNGDGYADLIAPTESKDSVSVFMNNGDGTFADDVEYLTGDGPFGITVADVDGDGDMDLATSNYASSTVSVLKNNGDGTYAAKSDYGTGSSPRALTNSDVDNDGDADIIVAYISGVTSGGVSVLKNNGDGTFAAKVDYPTSFGSFNPVAQDVDGDGDIDIVNANAAPGNNFSLFKNNGNGTFAAKVDYLNGTNMYAVAAGDLDGNGIVDFVAGQAATNLVTVMLNILPPSVTATSPQSNVSNASTSGNITITFDQAMFADSLNSRTILINGSQSGRHGGSISYNTGNFTATFNPTDDFAVGEKVTVVVTTSVQNSKFAAMPSPYVFQFNTYLKGDVISNQHTLFSPGYRPYGVAHADLDNDGDSDMILPLAEKDSISILTNDGTGNYSTITQIYAGSGALPYSVSTGDFNRDGQIDFVVTNYSYNNIEVYLNTGSLTFSRTTYSAQNGTVASVAVDFDGDGDIDIAAYNRSSPGGTVSIFMNNGNGTFASAVNTSYYDYNATKMVSVDIDGDNDIDLVTSGQGSYVYILKNNGVGSFNTSSGSTGLTNADDVKFADLDSDNDVDMVVVYSSSNKVTVYKNNGNGTFASGADFAFNNPSSVTFMDLAFDGDVDVLVSAHDGDYYDELYYLTNNGSGSFTKEYGFYLQENGDYSYGGYPTFSTADVDNDGDLDLVQTSRLGSYVAINKSSDFVTVTALTPAPNSIDVSVSSNMTATFNYAIDGTTINSVSVVAYGTVSGVIPGSISYDSPSKTLTFNPTSDFKAGETVTLTVTDSVTSLNGTHLSSGKSTEFIVETAGSGLGHFVKSATVKYPTDKYPSSFATGDMNGDGDVDFVTSDSYSGTLSVVISNGDGTYAAPVFYSATNPTNVITSDFDGDGDLDVAVMRSGNSTVYFFTNDGSGVLTSGNTFDSYFSYQDYFRLTDVDSDGKLDFIIDSGSSQSSNFYFNTGTWSYDHNNYDNNYGDKYSVTADLDNDGDLDHVQTYRNSGTGTLQILKNIGNRKFSSTITVNLPSQPRYIASGDFDNDGDVDLVVGDYNNPKYYVLKNNGDGSFADAITFTHNLLIIGIKVADINHDGDLDLIFGSNNPDENGDNVISTVLNDGTGNFSSSASFLIPDGGSMQDFSISDADNDGDLDLVVLHNAYPSDNSYYRGITVYSNTTATAPTAAASNITFDQNLGSIVKVKWNNGDGSRHMVVMKAGSAVNATPNDNGNYEPSAVYGEGSDIGNGNYVVYSGSGSSVTVSGLSLSATYHFSVFELNGNEGDEKFYSTSAPTGNVTMNAKDGYPFETTAGKALSFNGSSSIGEFSYENQLPADITIQMWVKVADSSNIAAFFVRGDSQGISQDGGSKVSIRPSSNKVRGNTHSKVSAYSPGNSRYSYPIHLGINDGHFYASIYDDDNGEPVNISGTDTVNSNQWYHVALTMHYDAESYYANGKLYVNGNAVGTYQDVYFNDYEYSFLLGYDGHYYFQGELDELQVRDKVLTTDEIRASMHTTLTGFPSKLLGYWQFNEGTGTTSSQQINSNKFYFEDVAWVDSDAPIGEGTVSAASGFSTGTQAVGKATLNMADGFDNPVDITVTEVAGDPNKFPDGYTASVGSKVFVIELFGNPGTFSANLTLNYGVGVITSQMESNPSSIILYKRPSTSTGAWTDLGGAVYANASTGDVRWEGITSFSQFMAGNSATVPVELTTFSANLIENKVSLNWATATETNNSGWEIQQGTTPLTLPVNGETKERWRKVGFVAGKGTTTEKQSYSFSVSGLTGSKAEFRLKQIDANGSVSYSNVLTVDLIPSKFELSQNYPNPFNPNTAIRFSLPVAGHVELAVYNMLGQKIMTLVNGEKEAGYHIFSFDGRNLASGSYFYVLNAGNFHSVKKFMLMK